MPAFNAAAFIAEAVESVLAQEFDSWELLIADDGSTDRTLDVAQAFSDPRIQVLPGLHTGLPAAARNRALGMARGEFVALLDADDAWHPSKLARQLDVLAARLDAGAVHTNAVVLGDRYWPPKSSGMVRDWPDFQALLRTNCLLNSSVLLRHSLLERHGGFDEDSVLRGTEDYELWLRLAPHTRFVYLDEPLITYRDHANGVSKRRRDLEVGVLAAQDRNLHRYPNELARVDPAVLCTIGALRARYRLPGRGRPELLRSLRRDPLNLRSWKWLGLSFAGARLVDGLLERRRRPHEHGAR
jgi:glycosyltransferase involved in cell wall biosynthesis